MVPRFEIAQSCILKHSVPDESKSHPAFPQYGQKKESKKEKQEKEERKYVETKKRRLGEEGENQKGGGKEKRGWEEGREDKKTISRV